MVTYNFVIAIREQIFLVYIEVQSFIACQNIQLTPYQQTVSSKMDMCMSHVSPVHNPPPVAQVNILALRASKLAMATPHRNYEL
jgi:hypothetical protein